MDNPYPAATIVVGVGTITAAGMIVGAFGRPRRRAAAGGGDEAKHEGGDWVVVGTLSPRAAAGSAQDGVPRDYAAAWAIQSRYSRQ